jgi:Cdc6-like AAA superfamily ATPase
MSIDLVRDVLTYLLEQLHCKTKLTMKNMWSLSMSAVEAYPLPILIILDEVDELLSSNDMENVYKLLEWPHQSANLLMIGNNACDRQCEIIST